uniref:Uncharacterized protein n=1 Tax=Ascaris lumbricoides TaxID=6252 RepID=A0A0M3HYR9_ASCLU
MVTNQHSKQDSSQGAQTITRPATAFPCSQLHGELCMPSGGDTEVRSELTKNSETQYLEQIREIMEEELVSVSAGGRARGIPRSGLRAHPSI